jgi:type III pantothenate kinase
MNLLVDVGNSRLKWACESDGKLTEQSAVLHQQLDWQTQLFSAWQTLPKPKKLLISSVAQAEIQQAITGSAKQLWRNISVIIPNSQAEGFGVKSSYLYPEKLGVDRWLCLIAARHFYSQAAWIVDCGTAITVDFIDANGVHGGGLIAPGLTLMKKALLQNTAALNFSQQSYQVGLANRTEAAIFSGTLYAAVGLIEQALKMQTVSAVVLLTGGDAALIGAHLSQTFITEPDLVLKGLSIFGRTEL